MKKIIIALMIGVIVGAPAGFALSKMFPDVPTNEWYASAVTSLTDKGIIEGYPDGTFRPTNNVNRAELAVMLDRLIDYIENGQIQPSTQTDNSVQISSTIPSENDNFSFTTEVSAYPVSITGDTLKAEVAYSGGCTDHDFTLVWDGTFLESYPVQAELYLIHDSNGDMCEAYINQILEFDLTPLKEAYNEGYQTSGGTILMTIHGSGNNEESTTYEF